MPTEAQTAAPSTFSAATDATLAATLSRGNIRQPMMSTLITDLPDIIDPEDMAEMIQVQEPERVVEAPSQATPKVPHVAVWL